MREIIDELKRIKENLLKGNINTTVDDLNTLIKSCEKKQAFEEAKALAIPTPQESFIEAPAGTHITINANECYITFTKDIGEDPDA